LGTLLTQTEHLQTLRQLFERGTVKKFDENSKTNSALLGQQEDHSGTPLRLIVVFEINQQDRCQSGRAIGTLRRNTPNIRGEIRIRFRQTGRWLKRMPAALEQDRF